jgi:prevent-host-death family protein
MQILSLSEAKMKLSGLVDRVQAMDEEIIITRNGSPAAVLISSAEYESLKETAAVRSDAALMEESEPEQCVIKLVVIGHYLH